MRAIVVFDHVDQHVNTSFIVFKYSYNIAEYCRLIKHPILICVMIIVNDF